MKLFRRLKRSVALALAFLSILHITDVKFFYFAENVGIVDKAEALNGRQASQNTFIRNYGLTGNCAELTAAGLYGGIMEGVIVSLSNLTGNQNIETRSFVSGGHGWQIWRGNNQMTGIVNGGVYIQAIQIRLVNLPGWSIYYRLHQRGGTWTAWHANGTTAGSTAAGGAFIDAIQIYAVQNPTLLRVTHLNHDQTLVNHNPLNYDATFAAAYMQAMEEINKEFKVLIIPSAPSELTGGLNGGAFPVGTCNRDNSLVCLEPHPSGAQNCLHYNHDCDGFHHRSAVRLSLLLDALPKAPSAYRLGLARHAICTSSNHATLNSWTAGYALTGDKTALVTAFAPIDEIVKAIQHEVTHLIAADTHCVGSQDCIIHQNGSKQKFNHWCNVHHNKIVNRRNATPPLI